MESSEKWLFLIFYPICAFATIHIGNDNTFLELLSIPSYYTDLCIAFALSFSIGFYIRFISNRLTRIYKDEIVTAIRLHFLYGILPPLVFAILMEILYLQSIEISIQESSIFYLETPLILLFLLFGNAFYVVRSVYTFQSAKLAELDSLNKKTKEHSDHINVSKGATNYIIKMQDIAHFEFSEKLTYLVTFNKEKYILNESLQSVYEKLNPAQFYILNRQVIANKTNIQGYEQLETRKLLINLKIESVEKTFVSKARAGEFIRWLK